MKHIISLSITASLATACLSATTLLSTHASAAGFAVTGLSTTAAGTSLAGAGVSTDNASYMWYNAASLAHQKERHIAGGFQFIGSRVEYEDKGSLYRPTDARYTGTPLTGTGSIKDGNAVVPHIYYAHPINDKMTFGFGLTAPFGLVTEYDESWVGRYHGTKTDLKTINFNPAIGYNFSDRLSVGLGLNVQYANAELTQNIDSSLACLSALNSANLTSNNALVTSCLTSGDGKGVIEGDNIEFGWNIGLIYEIDSHSKLGIAYRSGMEHKLEGTGSYTLPSSFRSILDSFPAPANSLFTETDAIAQANIPDVASFALEILGANHKTRYLMDLTWTGWSDFDVLQVDYKNPVQPQTLLPQRWGNSFRLSLGTSHAFNDSLTVRAGISYDQEAVTSEQFRSVRTPDTNRTWYSIGATKTLKPSLDLDVAYSYLTLETSAIDNTDQSFGHQLRGEYSGDIHILSAQLNWSF